MNTQRMNIILGTNWKFFKGNADGAFYRGYDDSAWKTVTVPHDWSVSEPFNEHNSSGTGYVAGGIGWYRKSCNLPAEFADKKVFLAFDGVYNNSQVWFNGNNLGKRPYGYSSFSYDVTEFCDFTSEANVISVKVSHTDLADSRWFTGSGIYREARLEATSLVHVARHGLVVTAEIPSVTNGAPGASANAQVCIETRVVNDSAEAAQVTVKQTVIAPDGRHIVSGGKAVIIAAKKSTAIPDTINIPEPALWSPESPALYTVLTEILIGGTVVDSITTRTGIRSIRFESANGFFLNGMHMKIKGVCVHHDAGCLGAAVPSGVWAHRLSLLQDMGCNAIRTSHNPPDPKFLDLCDEMGFLVMDEAFDEWEAVKNKWSTGHNVYPPKHFGYGDDFPEWHERDLREMVLRDRNHPSIIAWSIGNEVDYPNDPYCHPYFKTMVGNNDANKPEAEQQYDPDKPNAERLASIARNLVSIVKDCDRTRPVTAAIAFPELSNITGYCEALDIVGYNYKEGLYAADHASWPGRVLYGSENGSSYAQWLYVRDTPYICAQFIWTGIDYLGEAKGWPVHASPAGFIDLAGFPKPKYYFRKSLWQDSPVLYLSVARKESGIEGARHIPLLETASWNWEPGEPLEIQCYTNCPSVDLFLNGRALGKKTLAQADGGYLSWEVNFEAGELSAEGYGPEDFVQSDAQDYPQRCVLKTASSAARLVASTDSSPVKADGLEIVRIEIGVVDKSEVPVPVPDSRAPIEVAISGNGTLMGLENGDIADVESYSSPRRKAFHGRLVAYVRTTESPGEIIITASSPGLVGASARIVSKY